MHRVFVFHAIDQGSLPCPAIRYIVTTMMTIIKIIYCIYYKAIIMIEFHIPPGVILKSVPPGVVE